MSERLPRRYGVHNDRIEDPKRCFTEVVIFGQGRILTMRQCSRKRGFGKDGLYCKQHAKRHPA